jgi:excisionase family DNA binding protein
VIRRFISLPVAAKLLGVGRTTAYEMAADGDFATYTVRGRLKTTREDVAAYQERVRQPAAAERPAPKLVTLAERPRRSAPLVVDDEETDRLAASLGLR